MSKKPVPEVECGNLKLWLKQGAYIDLIQNGHRLVRLSIAQGCPGGTHLSFQADPVIRIVRSNAVNKDESMERIRNGQSS
jgi:hypothetical protein